MSRSKSKPKITGGIWRGRPIIGGIPQGVRPTSSRVREAICSIVQAQISKAHVLDAFGGAGTMALEFRSRGAEKVTVIEKNTQAFQSIQRSCDAFEESDSFSIHKGDTLRFLASNPTSEQERFNLVLLDPPYKTKLGEKALELLIKNNWLRKDAVVLLESDSKKEAPNPPAPLAIRGLRRYGDTTLYIFDFCG